MTAPTINGARYPQPVEALLPAARALADELGEVPSRNRLMRDFRIGAPKAGELLALLRDSAEREAAVLLSAAPAAEIASRILDAGLAPVAPGAGIGRSVSPIGDTTSAPPGPDLRPVFLAPDPGPCPVVPGSAAAIGTMVPTASNDAVGQVAASGHPGPASSRRQLLRVRWAVRAVLALGVAASIAGNVLHARDELISQIISAWSPLALLLTVELISRVPVHRRYLAVTRLAATALIAGIAAWVSYWHMVAVAFRYGETGGAQYLLPLSVDGLVVVASICLVELGGRIAAGNSTRT